MKESNQGEAMTPLLHRVKNILLTPKTEWPVIEKEGGTIGDVYARYVVFLAAIPAVASFIGFAVFGMSMLGINVRLPVGTALASAVASYVMTLAIVYVLSLVANALAPKFGGQKNHFNAFKLIAYAYTASFVVGILMLIPSLGTLAILGGLYSLYLLYVGLPVMMKHPEEKNLPYFIVLFLCGIVASVVLAALTSCFTPAPRLGDMGGVKINSPMGKIQVEGSDAGAGNVTIKGPGGAEIKVESKGGKDGTVTINAPGANIELDAKKMEEFAKKMEEAGKKMEGASKSGDPAAALKALQEALKAQQAPAK
jgi:hypothetical protein